MASSVYTELWSRWQQLCLRTRKRASTMSYGKRGLARTDRWLNTDIRNWPHGNTVLLPDADKHFPVFSLIALNADGTEDREIVALFHSDRWLICLSPDLFGKRLSLFAERVRSLLPSTEGWGLRPRKYDGVQMMRRSMSVTLTGHPGFWKLQGYCAYRENAQLLFYDHHCPDVDEVVRHRGYYLDEDGVWQINEVFVEVWLPLQPEDQTDVTEPGHLWTDTNGGLFMWVACREGDPSDADDTDDDKSVFKRRALLRVSRVAVGGRKKGRVQVRVYVHPDEKVVLAVTDPIETLIAAAADADYTVRWWNDKKRASGAKRG